MSVVLENNLGIISLFKANSATINKPSPSCSSTNSLHKFDLEVNILDDKQGDWKYAQMILACYICWWWFILLTFYIDIYLFHGFQNLKLFKNKFSVLEFPWINVRRNLVNKRRETKDDIFISCQSVTFLLCRKRQRKSINSNGLRCWTQTRRILFMKVISSVMKWHTLFNATPQLEVMFCALASWVWMCSN